MNCIVLHSIILHRKMHFMFLNLLYQESQPCDCVVVFMYGIIFYIILQVTYYLCIKILLLMTSNLTQLPYFTTPCDCVHVLCIQVLKNNVFFFQLGSYTGNKILINMNFHIYHMYIISWYRVCVHVRSVTESRWVGHLP